MTHLKILTVSAVAACLTAVAAPALADTGDSFNFAFRYDQADLADADGVARVHAALNSAAYSACQITAPSAQRGLDRDCRDKLVARVVERMGNSQMAELEAKRDRLSR